MLKRLADFARRQADVLDPPPISEPRSVRVVSDRQEAALSLMDDEVLGFVLVRVCDGDPMPSVEIAGDVDPEHEFAVGATLRDIARVAYGVR